MVPFGFCKAKNESNIKRFGKKRWGLEKRKRTLRKGGWNAKRFFSLPQKQYE